MHIPEKIIYILFLILPATGTAQNYNPELIKYAQNIFKQAATGNIVAFDSTMRRLPADTLYYRYVSAKPGIANDWSDNYYTPATAKEDSFIKVFHFGLFEGLMGMPDLVAMIFDTVNNKCDPKYIAFRNYEFQDAGGLKAKKTVLLIARITTPINKKLVSDKAIKTATDSQNRNKAKTLTTNDNEYWQISELLVNNKKVPLDICQSRYHLQLSANMHFRQYYSDTTDFNINRKAFVDTGIERVFYFPKDKQHMQCYLENESGIWSINNGKLVLLTCTGITLINYKVLVLKKDQMQVQVHNYKLRLIKKLL